ncbi:hypothetical protein TNCV_3197201 [Trichonephila clavipes]|nr:hypothetical protein TNCV_3197201 [Trichonephila clavipes]
MNTQDNTIWQYQKFFRKKRSDIPSLNDAAITDEQKANLLAETFQSNFTDNIRPENFNTNIDTLVTNTLENFFSSPPSIPITPTDPDEIINYANHHTVSTCLFADDSAALTQGVQLKYTIKTMQRFLDELENWLTDWRIAINVEKTQAIVFRKWGVIDPQTELTHFDNIQWVPVATYEFVMDWCPLGEEFYPYCIEDTDKYTPEKIVLRINLENEEEAENFKNCYSVVSNTNWIVYGCTPNPQR